MVDQAYIGKVGRQPLSALADKAAVQVMRPRASARSVCIDPDGVVTVEPPSDVVPDDIVGTYTKGMGWLALCEQIYEDMRHELGLRAASAPKAA